MKKLFLFLCCFPVVVFAQTNKFFVGGSLSISSSSYKSENSMTPYTSDVNSFTINPMAGYYLSPQLAIGLSAGYGTSQNRSTMSPTSTIKGHQFSIAPFVLYHFYSFGNFSLVGKGSIEYQSSFSKSESTPYYIDLTESYIYSSSSKTQLYSVSVAPGITYQINNHFRAETYLGYIGYSHEKEPDNNSKTNSFSLSLSNSLIFSLLYFF